MSRGCIFATTAAMPHSTGCRYISLRTRLVERDWLEFDVLFYHARDFSAHRFRYVAFCGRVVLEDSGCLFSLTNPSLRL